MPKMPERLDVCPWCTVVVVPGATGGMTPVVDGKRWWHQGCVADATRASQELSTFEDPGVPDATS